MKQFDYDEFEEELALPQPLGCDDESIEQMLLEQQKVKDDLKKGLYKGMTLPMTAEQAQSLDHSDWKYLSEYEPEWKFAGARYPGSFTNAPSREELLRVALGKQTCPVCLGAGKYRVTERGTATGVFRSSDRECLCIPPTRVQRFLDKIVREEYRECDLRTLSPSHRSCLPHERQAEEIAFLKSHTAENYFFLGPAGTSKSTFATALLRESAWRNKDYVMDKWAAGRSPFCWKVNAEKLFVQNMAWKTSMGGENPAPAPDVTPDKIDAAKARGLFPTLIIEELDKTKLTDSRVNFLFDLIDAMDGCKGQVIVTSNRTLDRFMAMFEESDNESVRVTGGPLMRRLLKNCNVRNYFE